ncbi:class I mannose-6-phosphate isomerase [Brooklawnia cerclae]|uniref:Mannose-6-phosphate isomerase n=1 Tax=Brooklawnia cerclae TaxID=349934 RepID=A0ABX0SAP7_9ACTN|nr:mannose-6-phosphate isomerase [Brooklawnia cerclae]NIH55404.1 mannose-6-phosphate isomerase [Brooklawnia cerclae]
MTASPALCVFEPNRVRRNYRGGAGIDRLLGASRPVDGDRPEDWVGSLVEARNPGLPEIPGEGLARVRVPGGEPVAFADLIASDPGWFLGAGHRARYGDSLGFLTKLLDSSMRLHMQAHPTREFSRARLDSEWGKFEAYYVLAARDPEHAYIRLGFQHLSSREEWRRIVVTQDIAAMDACFDPVPVRVGDIVHIPGAVAHAIGEGITLVEIMEPSDWVVRCEFVREGIEVPPPARFMGRDLDFCMDVFDYANLTTAQVRERYFHRPEPVAPGLDRLLSAEVAPTFEVFRVRPGADPLPASPRFAVALVTRGEATLRAGGSQVHLGQAQSGFVAAGAGRVDVEVSDDGELLLVTNLA